MYTKDQKLGIKIHNETIIGINKQTDTVMVYDGIGLEISDIKRTNIVKISMNIIGYTFHKNNQEITDNKGIEEIISLIQSKSLTYYAELCRDPEFIQVIEKIELEKIKGTKEYDDYINLLKAIQDLSPALPQETNNNEETQSMKKSGR